MQQTCQVLLINIRIEARCARPMGHRCLEIQIHQFFLFFIFVSPPYSCLQLPGSKEDTLADSSLISTLICSQKHSAHT